MPVAFGVRASYADIWEPGVVAVGDSSVNLKELLEQGDGQIVAPDSDALFIQTLDEQPALKRVAVRTAEETARTSAAKAEKERLEALTVEELRKLSAGLVSKSASKEEHVNALASKYEADWTPESVTGA